MKLDTGTGGSIVVANHIAALIGLKPDIFTPEPTTFEFANGILVKGMTRTRDPSYGWKYWHAISE